jgi:thymidine kinase
MAGTIEIMIGPMRSNKTAELIRRVAMRGEYAHQSVILFKPMDDTKSAQGMVQSRNQLSHRQMEAVEFDSSNPWEMLGIISEHERALGKPVNCVAIDEGQFVHELFDCARSLLEKGYDVLAAGLDLDFRGHPFGDMLALGWLVNAYGGSITWCIAYCECGQRAFFSQRLINGEAASYDSPTVVPGDSYRPRCAKHFVLPGRPKRQMVLEVAEPSELETRN